MGPKSFGKGKFGPHLTYQPPRPSYEQFPNYLLFLNCRPPLLVLFVLCGFQNQQGRSNGLEKVRLSLLDGSLVNHWQAKDLRSVKAGWCEWRKGKEVERFKRWEWMLFSGAVHRPACPSHHANKHCTPKLAITLKPSPNILFGRISSCPLFYWLQQELFTFPYVTRELEIHPLFSFEAFKLFFFWLTIKHPKGCVILHTVCHFI